MILLSTNISKHAFLQKIVTGTYQDEIECVKKVEGACDTNWNHEYDFFYKKQINSKPYVTRCLFSFKGKGKRQKAGFVNIRPISDGSEVAETYLCPPKKLTSPYDAYIKCMGEYNVYGETVKCVPFIMPDCIFGMCAHASIWICLSILENRGLISEVPTIPEIQKLATGQPYNDEQGLLFRQASRLLRLCRISVLYVDNKEFNDKAMIDQLYAYVESKFPVIIGVDSACLNWWKKDNKSEYHTLVVIGHTMKDNKPNGFIVHDESVLPYQVIENAELMSAWHQPMTREMENYHKENPSEEPSNAVVREFLVAVPPEVSLSYYDVSSEYDRVMHKLCDNGKLIDQQDVANFTSRPVLMPIEELWAELQINWLISTLSDANFPKYVWVIYFNDKNNSMDKPHGFFVRDATKQTDYFFIYVFKKKEGIYHLKGKTYTIYEGKSNRKLVKSGIG
ncbi:MAG: hypothetical protein LBC03_03860 [Nitrososphaerota archaeon]|nr:hypothetical protein [Nitrososphaerota archaeon]